ncbi:MAG: DEAD/DEAH box helicase [Planctomycetes bacterium]|nr:DEAD/DEAH box helicase [Planctomycetota bacterium]
MTGSDSSSSTSSEVADVLFRNLPFSEAIHQDLAAAGFERPTPIQAAAIPPALEGRDVIGLAQTGTGKTAAFALPIIQRLAQRLELGALVLAPTRELAVQITRVFEQLGRTSGVRAATIVGGVPMDQDLKALRSWPNVLVATPGRLMDHIQYGTVHLNEIEVLVVDEADRMHDMGFIPQIRYIVLRLPAERQTMMFTATMDREVEKVIRESMRDPLRIQIGRQGAPAQRAEQRLYAVHEEERTPLLVKLLRANGDGRVLVFVRTKRGVDRLIRSVRHAGLAAAHIHGGRQQSDRDEVMAGFREGRYRVLIATDIAARGIDVADIGHVINYDFPRHPEDYVHRIGRTARVEASGLAISFVTRADRRWLSEVKKLIGDALPELEPSPLSGKGHGATDEVPRSGGHHHGKSRSPRRRRGGKGNGRKPADSAAAGGQGAAEGSAPEGPPAAGDGETKPKKKRRRRGGRRRGGRKAEGGQPEASGDEAAAGE